MRFSIHLFLALCNGEATFRKFIIITMMLPFPHDSALRSQDVLEVRVPLSSELTGESIHRLLAGELDVAAVLLPEGKAAPPPLGSGRRLRICLTA